MAPITRPAFRKRLRRLDRESFIVFVKTLWEGRGYDVDRNGDRFVVTDGTTTTRIWIHHRAWWAVRPVEPPADPIDVVISNRSTGPKRLPPGGPDVVCPAELRDIALYAIDRETRTRVFERYLGRPPVIETERTGIRTERRQGLTALLVGVAVLLLVGTALSSGGIPSVAGLTTSIEGTKSMTSAVSPSSPTPAGSGTFTNTETIPTRTPSGGASNGSYPPGLAPTGITDADRIADRHAARLAGRSYEVVFAYREVVEDQVVGAVREIARVQAPTIYASKIQRLTPPMNEPSIIAGTAAYADGQRRVTRSAPNRSTPVDRRAGGEGRFTDRVETYLRWYLTVSESTVVDRMAHANHTYYWIRLGDDPWPGLVNSSGRVLIDDRGVVRFLSVTYRKPDTRTRITIGIRYTAIGNTTVRPPEWYNETRSMRSPTVGAD